MNNFDENELIDKAMAGRLSGDEQKLWEALLAERPELQAEVEIGRAMRQMPKPPAVSSNFTALVLQAVNEVEPVREATTWLSWFRLPRFAALAGTAAVALALALTTMRHQHQHELAASVETFTGAMNVVAAKPDGQSESVVRLLQDFDAIKQLPPASSDVDYGLLAALRSEE